jgi:hypothetical protein
LACRVRQADIAQRSFMRRWALPSRQSKRITMVGDGQPQTQAAIFTRHMTFGKGPQEAIAAPRWLLGRNWGSAITNLRMENRFTGGLIEQLKATGHEIEVVGPYEELMGTPGPCPAPFRTVSRADRGRV